MALQSKGAGGQNPALAACFPFHVVRFGVIDDGLIIKSYDDPFALHFNVLREPLIILHKNIFHILDGIQAACSSPVSVRVVHLGLITFFWPTALLVISVKINTRV